MSGTVAPASHLHSEAPGSSVGTPAGQPVARPPSRPTRTRARKAWLAVGPLLLYLVAGVLPLWPYRHARLTTHPEIYGVVGGIIEARAAIAEGQFPARVAPHQLDGRRYPVLQFYGGLPFNLGALTMVATSDRLDPYAAWKLQMWLALACGGYFTYRCAYRLTRHRSAALAAGLVFLTAPYLFTDLRARGAVAEATAMCLVPAALYATVRCAAAGGRRGWRCVPWAAVAWSAIALTHNITYLYAAAVVALFLLPPAISSLIAAARRPARWRRVAGRGIRLLALGTLHLLLVAWYFAPSAYVLRDLTVGKAGAPDANPHPTAELTPIGVLLAPVLVTPAKSTTPLLGLQVGWAIMAGAAGAAWTLLFARRRLPRAGRAAAARLLALFAAAFLLVWSPVDVWRFVPPVFYFVQWTFRLLVFVAVIGALLSAVALAALFPRGLGGMRAGVWGMLLLALAIPTYTYVNDLPLLAYDGLAAARANPEVGARTDYLVASAAATRTGDADPAANLAEWHWGLCEDGLVRHRTEAVLPAPPGATGFVIEGSLPAGQAPAALWVGAGAWSVSRRLPPGPFRIAVPFTHRRDLPPPGADGVARPVRLMLQLQDTAAPYGGPVPQAIVMKLDRVTWAGPATEPAAAAAGRTRITVPREAVTIRSDGRAATVVRCDAPARVRLPVVYYPHLLEVRAGGTPVSYFNTGRVVTVDLPPGRHRVDVRFVGVRWANAASLTGVCLLAVAFAAPRVGWLVRGRRRRARNEDSALDAQ